MALGKMAFGREGVWPEHYGNSGNFFLFVVFGRRILQYIYSIVGTGIDPYVVVFYGYSSEDALLNAKYGTEIFKARGNSGEKVLAHYGK